MAKICPKNVFYVLSFILPGWRLVFTSEGVGVGLVVVVGVIRETSENRSHKWSQKLARISVSKIRMVLFLFLFPVKTGENLACRQALLMGYSEICFRMARIIPRFAFEWRAVKTALLDSEAEVEEPTNHKAGNETLWKLILLLLLPTPTF